MQYRDLISRDEICEKKLLQLNISHMVLTSVSTTRLSARSDLFPAKAMMMLGLACLCNSLIHVLARVNVSFKKYYRTKMMFYSFTVQLIRLNEITALL